MKLKKRTIKLWRSLVNLYPNYNVVEDKDVPSLADYINVVGVMKFLDEMSEIQEESEEDYREELGDNAGDTHTIRHITNSKEKADIIYEKFAKAIIVEFKITKAMLRKHKRYDLVEYAKRR